MEEIFYEEQSNCSHICESRQEESVSICDNTNRTHKTICSFAKKNCEQQQQNKEQQILVHIGACQLISPVFNLTV